MTDHAITADGRFDAQLERAKAFNENVLDIRSNEAQAPDMNTATPTTTYQVSVYVMNTWATGSPRGTSTRTFEVTEDATILGGMRAIDQAVARCNGHDLCDIHSPDITPNPAELGWPVR